MYCRECPYGKEDFEKMMSWYEITATEKGMPNDIYHDLKPEDAADEFEKFLWCDKVGGKTFRVGRCEDAYIQSEISQNYSKQKRRSKRERDFKYKAHVKFLAQTYSGYPPIAIPVGENGKYNFDDPVGTVYYKRIHRGRRKPNRYKYYKKYANGRVRQYKGDIKSGNSYRKIFDYWYTVI